MTPEEFLALVLYRDPRYQAFALYEDEEFGGYGLVGPYRSRSAYRVSSEVALYLQAERTGRGLGPTLLQHLEWHARQHGLHSLIAGVCTENDASVRLFAKAATAIPSAMAAKARGKSEPSA